MKLLLGVWLVAVTHGILAQGVAWEALAHHHTVPSSARASFERLARGTLSDQDKGSQELVDTPGIAPVLMELLETVYKGPEACHQVYTILNVMVQRRDLAEKEQGILRSKLEEIWSKPGNANSVVLKDYGLKTIANYPGEANEVLLLKYLKEPKSLEVVGFPLNAVEGLEKIGTERSLEALQAYLVQHPEDDVRNKRAKEVIEAIIARNKPKGSGAIKEPTARR